MELKLGFMSTEELAAWSGRSVAHMKKNKKQWCANNLVIYADYELTRGGVNILKIKNKVFYSSGYQEVKTKWRGHYGYDGVPLDSCVKCWEKLSENMTTKLKDVTGISYVGQCRREAYGVARRDNKYDGHSGYCHFVYCKEVDDKPVLFTSAEEKIKKELQKKYFSTEEQAKEKEYRKALLQSYKKGEIDKEEYIAAIFDLDDNDAAWLSFQEEFEKRIGYPTAFYVYVVDDAIKQYHSELLN